jgi:hypothetical protein
MKTRKTVSYTRGQYNIKSPKTVHLDLRADENFKTQLKQLSKKRNTTMSKILRELVQNEYDKNFTLIDLLTLESNDTK